MTREHSITAAAAADWTASAELVDGELKFGALTPSVGPDRPEYYYCTCGEEFRNKAEAAEHLRSVGESNE